jgi:hypothetical protein
MDCVLYWRKLTTCKSSRTCFTGQSSKKRRRSLHSIREPKLVLGDLRRGTGWQMVTLLATSVHQQERDSKVPLYQQILPRMLHVVSPLNPTSTAAALRDRKGASHPVAAAAAAAGGGPAGGLLPGNSG